MRDITGGLTNAKEPRCNTRISSALLLLVGAELIFGALAHLVAVRVLGVEAACHFASCAGVDLAGGGQVTGVPRRKGAAAR